MAATQSRFLRLTTVECLGAGCRLCAWPNGQNGGMLRLLVCALAIISTGCSFAAAGAGTSGNVSWAFTINNTLPPSAVIAGGGGLVVIITYSDGSSSTVSVPPGGSVTVPSNGAAAVVSGGGANTSVGPGTALWWTTTGWSTTPPIPSGAG